MNQLFELMNYDYKNISSKFNLTTLTKRKRVECAKKYIIDVINWTNPNGWLIMINEDNSLTLAKIQKRIYDKLGLEIRISELRGNTKKMHYNVKG